MKTKNKPLMIAGFLLIAILGAAVYYQIYAGLRAEQDSIRKEIKVKTAILEKQIVLISRMPQLQGELASLKEQRKADNQKIIEGQTAALAAANLQNTVKSVLISKGGAISSQRVERPEDVGKFKAVSVTVDGVLPDMRALSETIYALEMQTPSLVIKELDVRVKNYRDPRELMVKLKIAALASGQEFRVQSSEFKVKDKDKTLGE